jgi:hypothetical protein
MRLENLKLVAPQLAEDLQLSYMPLAFTDYEPIVHELSYTSSNQYFMDIYS